MKNGDIPRSSYNVREFAQSLGLGYVKTWEWEMAGTIRSYSVGRRRLIPATELTDFPERQLAAQSANSGK